MQNDASIQAVKLQHINQNARDILINLDAMNRRNIFVIIFVLILCFSFLWLRHFNNSFIDEKELISQEKKEYRISGISMEPNFLDGESVDIDIEYYKKGKIEKGDVIAFKFENSKETRVKRVAAEPGDIISFLMNEILINGERVDNASVYNTLAWKTGSEVVVPNDMYFVLGDNPAGWEDSRKWGFVPKKAIIGKVIKK